MSTATWLIRFAPAPAHEMCDGAGHDAKHAPASAGEKTGRRLTTTEIGEADDERLVARVAAGDQRAFGELVRRHGGRLRALALRFSGAASEADDIVQETFLSFWRTADRWQAGGAPLGAYLTRIAVNRAIDADRRRRVRRFFGLADANEIRDPSPIADERLADRRALAAVTEDIGRLPARQRAAILLAADGERSNVDIGAAMELSEGAVEQLLVRARRTLRMRLAERGG